MRLELANLAPDIGKEREQHKGGVTTSKSTKWLWSACHANERAHFQVSTKTYIRARTQAWKRPLFADSGRKHTPFSTEIADYFEVPLLKQNAILFSIYKIKYPLWKRD